MSLPLSLTQQTVQQLSLKDEPAIIINTTNSEQLSLKDEPAIIINTTNSEQLSLKDGLPLSLTQQTVNS